MVLYHLYRPPPLNRFYSPNIVNLQGEKHVFFIGKTQLVPAGYVVNKNGLGGSVWVPNKIETSLLISFPSMRIFFFVISF